MTKNQLKWPFLTVSDGQLLTYLDPYIVEAKTPVHMNSMIG